MSAGSPSNTESPSQPLTPSYAPPLTRGHSCLSCQKRKVRCNGQRPCSACIKSGRECVSKGPTSARERKARANPIFKEDIRSRLQRCEELLKKAGIDVDSEVGQSPVARIERSLDSISAGLGESVAASETGKLIVEKGHSRYIENNLWTGLNEELQESDAPSELMDDVEKDLRQFEFSSESLLFNVPSANSLYPLHPDPIRIFRLWQTFLDNVNPLSKPFHAPTVQQQILKWSSNLRNVPRGFEALMFSIYLASVRSLTDLECQDIMGEPRDTLLTKFANGAQQALVNARFLKSYDIVVLQAFTLFLLAIRSHCDSQSLWMLTGLAIRSGQRAGLHRESALRKHTLFEAEMRRRLWWQIIILDNHSAALSGSSNIAKLVWDTHQPLNVNDSDLNPSMKDVPVEHKGATEMLFCSIRYEMGTSIRKFEQWGEQPENALTLASLRAKTIDELETIFEDKYQRYCDPSIPFHLISTYMARSAICGMRLRLHHPRPRLAPDSNPESLQREREMLLSSSLVMLEYDNLTHSTPSLRGYLWHVRVFFAFEAFIYILSELRAKRLEGELRERAWQQVSLSYKHHPEMLSDTKNALYVAIGNLALTAWEKSMPSSTSSEKFKGCSFEWVSILKSQRAKIDNNNGGSSSILSLRGPPKEGAWAADSSHPSDTSHSHTNLTEEFDHAALDATNISTTGITDTDMEFMDWEYWQNLIQGRDLDMYYMTGDQNSF
ncbi:hypothetical protein F5884DRAFT_390978 [Xylogone sp. PMI_703]|nr:hypothetical protein F5884DRAFT_390978 [Xylogone sp. PMI_703]